MTENVAPSKEKRVTLTCKKGKGLFRGLSEKKEKLMQIRLKLRNIVGWDQGGGVLKERIGNTGDYTRS